MESLLLSSIFEISGFFVDALSIIISVTISSIVVAWTLSSKINTAMHRLDVAEDDIKIIKDKTDEYYKEQLKGFASADKEINQKINDSEEKVDKKLDNIQDRLLNISVDVGAITEIIKSLQK